MAKSNYYNWEFSDFELGTELPKELRFVTEPPKEMLCPICSQILRDPFQTQCCSRFCCQGCLQKLVKQEKPCALCRKEVTAFRDDTMARRVNALAIKCSHEAWGCTWRGQLGELGDHLLQCAKRPVRCDLCGDTVLNKYLNAHKTSQCRRRTFRCPYCDNFQSTYETVRDIHWASCSLYPIPCPNECSKGLIPRGKVLQHLREECEVKKKVKKMAVNMSEMEKQLRLRDLRIEYLEKEAKENTLNSQQQRKSRSLSSPSYMNRQHPQLEEMKSNNTQLVEKVTEVQRERAELEHENFCLLQEREAQMSRIKELEVQNKNFRENLDRMDEELTSQQKVMKVMTEKLRDEKETLESKLQGMGQVKFSSLV